MIKCCSEMVCRILWYLKNIFAICYMYIWVNLILFSCNWSEIKTYLTTTGLRFCRAICWLKLALNLFCWPFNGSATSNLFQCTVDYWAIYLCHFVWRLVSLFYFQNCCIKWEQDQGFTNNMCHWEMEILSKYFWHISPPSIKQTISPPPFLRK